MLGPGTYSARAIDMECSGELLPWHRPRSTCPQSPLTPRLEVRGSGYIVRTSLQLDPCWRTHRRVQ